MTDCGDVGAQVVGITAPQQRVEEHSVGYGVDAAGGVDVGLHRGRGTGRRGETVYDVIVDVKINDSGRAAIGRGP